MISIGLTDDPATATDGPMAVARPNLPYARATLEMEARALMSLAETLTGAFAQAVKMILNGQGRVIVCGVGKSGHVGRKIAATLASTGTPAFFVHPTEASHGDMGMITRQDMVLAISNSGNTVEMKDVVAYTRRWQIPLILITSNPQSTLGEEADVVLLLPKQPEACPMGLAPTTSTTMTIALGDALAVELLARRGFTAEDYSAFHPGGALGARLVKVNRLMHDAQALPLVPLTAAMDAALMEMTAKAMGCVGVVDDHGRLVGIITDGDLRRHMGPDLLTQPVIGIMTADPVTIQEKALAVEALRVMNERKITGLFVVDGMNHRPTGFIHIHDCLRAGVA